MSNKNKYKTPQTEELRDGVAGNVDFVIEAEEDPQQLLKQMSKSDQTRKAKAASASHPAVIPSVETERNSLLNVAAVAEAVIDTGASVADSLFNAVSDILSSK